MTGAIFALAFISGMLWGWSVLPALAATLLLIWLTGNLKARFCAVAVLVAVAGILRAPSDAGPGWGYPSFTDQEVTVSSAVFESGSLQRFRVETATDQTLCVTTFGGVRVGRGDELVASFDADDPGEVPDGLLDWYASQGCVASGILESSALVDRGSGVRRRIDNLAESITRQFVQWVPGDKGALLAGLTIGDETVLSETAHGAFLETGTLHVVAISGANLTLLAAILLATFRIVPLRWFNEMLVLVAVWFYVLLAGLTPPTVRAGLLASAGAGARLAGRPADYLTLSIVVAALQVAIVPNAISGLSFRLSTVAVIVVVLIVAGRPGKSVWHALGLAILVPTAVQLTLLTLLPPDSRPNLLVAVLANVLISPFVSLAFVIGFVSAVISPVSPLAAEALAIVGGEVNRVTLWTVEGLAGWSVPSQYGFPPRLPDWAMLVLAGFMLASVSTEFRRLARDAWRALAADKGYVAVFVFGAGTGTLAGAALLALLR
ncbi:MAG: ComEC/Rec2 family competence protein [Chloroflexota bacterium]|nr:ComEC/Rec2 family competence protein [Chloroflexota bacterium]